MSTAAQPRATLDDLSQVEGKAELIGGRIVTFMPSGDRPSRIAFRVARFLDEFAARIGVGVAYADGAGFNVPELASGRESFSPDASYYVGPHPTDSANFIEGPSTFAVEVRSKGDFGPAAERAMAAKRDDYFEAGTLIVWDVDYRAEVVRSYRRTEAVAVEFRRGEQAHAEPAVPGWVLAVDLIFGPEA